MVAFLGIVTNCHHLSKDDDALCMRVWLQALCKVTEDFHHVYLFRQVTSEPYACTWDIMYCQFLVRGAKTVLAVNRYRHFRRGRRNCTRLSLTHAIFFWHRRSASRCLSSTWRSERRRNGERSATSWKRRRNCSDNFLKKHMLPASMICFHWLSYVFVRL